MTATGRRSPAQNLPSGGPAYPLSTPGIRLKFDPNKQLTSLAALFNGDPGPGPEDRADREPLRAELPRQGSSAADGRGAVPLQSGKGPTPGWPGFWRVGAGIISATSTASASTPAAAHSPIRLSNGIARKLRGTSGIYGVVDHQIYRPAGRRQGQRHQRIQPRRHQPPDRNPVEFYLDGGIVFSGMLPGRPDDKVAATFLYSHISRDAAALDRDMIAFTGMPQPIRDYELKLALVYHAQIVPGWTVQPAFHYIFHPGGHVPDPNAAVPSRDQGCGGAGSSLRHHILTRSCRRSACGAVAAKERIMSPSTPRPPSPASCASSPSKASPARRRRSGASIAAALKEVGVPAQRDPPRRRQHAHPGADRDRQPHRRSARPRHDAQSAAADVHDAHGHRAAVRGREARSIKGRKIVNTAKTALGGDNRTGCARAGHARGRARQAEARPSADHAAVLRARGERAVGRAHRRPGRPRRRPRWRSTSTAGSAADVVVGAVGADRWEVEIFGKRLACRASRRSTASRSTMVLALALAEVQTGGWFGKVVKGKKQGTSNVGPVTGGDGRPAGDATNVVTDYVHVRGESRSHDPKFFKADHRRLQGRVREAPRRRSRTARARPARSSSRRRPTIIRSA